MRRELHANSLVFKIVLTVTIGIVFLAVSIGAINMTVSKRVFVDNFAMTQRKAFNQIDYEFYKFFQDVTAIVSTVTRSENVEKYLMGADMDDVESMNNSYLLERQIRESKASNYSQMNVIIMGENEKSYMNNIADVFSRSKAEILRSRAAQSARKNRNKIICQYEEAGFTENTKNTPVIIIAKALSYENKGQANAFIFIVIKEVDLRSMYSHFTSDTSSIAILNQDNEVVSSDKSVYFEPSADKTKKLKKSVLDMEEEKVQQKTIKGGDGEETILIQQLQSTNYKVVGIINPERAFGKAYSTLGIMLITAAVTAVVVCMIILFLRQQTKPLSALVYAMKHSKESQFGMHVPVEGTYEIQELSRTYNTMVDEINRYIDQLINVEKEKRKADIHALQMKINPHYIYNTLATVKWLIWQQNAEKSTQVIDAFIMLLRNVISNSDEFVTVEQEIDNLKNYALINQARYGEDIQVEFFVIPQCNEYKVPKLILQPFVENAFFHGFPQGMKGEIRIFVREENENLRFEVTDNGIGMTKERLHALRRHENSKSEHFTGIGIGNVEDRIKLIYGMDYGILLESEEGKGTKVVLILPREEKSKKENRERKDG